MKQLLTALCALLAYQGQAQSAARVQRQNIFYGDYLREVRRPDSLACITSDMQRIDKLQGEAQSTAYFSRGRSRLLYYTPLAGMRLSPAPARRTTGNSAALPQVNYSPAGKYSSS